MTLDEFRSLAQAARAAIGGAAAMIGALAGTPMGGWREL